MLKEPKLSHLKALKQVAYYGSINATAKALNIPQPTLSRTVKELEEILKVPLIVRGSHGISLTKSGKRFAAQASSIISQLESATAEARALANIGESTLSVGLSPISINSIWDPAVDRLLKDFQHCQLSVEDNPLEINLSRVRDGTLDLAVGNADADVSLTEFAVEPLMDCPFAVVCRKGHPLENATRFEEIQNANWWITGELKVCMRKRADFREINLNQSLHTRSHIVGLPLIFSHSFLALLSSVQIKKYREHLSIIPIQGLNVIGHYALVYKKNVPLSSIATSMINYLHDEARKVDWQDFG